MDEREPSVLGGEPKMDTPAQQAPGPVSRPAEPAPVSAPAPMSRPRAADAPVVVVAGFWRRAIAALVDAALVLPLALGLAWLTSRLVGLSLPVARRAGLDYWLDLSLAGDPALWGAVGLTAAIALLYLLLFQMTVGRTLGMRLLGLKVIDVYGDDPGLLRAAVRTAGYVLGVLSFSLGFLWIGFDREKRGLHDWLAGTYVIRTAGPAGARRGHER